MKKGLILFLAAVFALSVVGTALANPVDISGTYWFQYRHNNKWSNSTNSADDWDNYKATFILNAKTALNSNLDFYARFAAQSVDTPNWTKDWNNGSYGPNMSRSYDADTRDVMAIDQFGFIYKNKGLEAKIGRQPVFIGALGTLYDSTGWLGKHRFVDGVKLNFQSGATAFEFMGGQEDNPGTYDDNKLYALHASYNPSKNVTLGALLGRYQYSEPGLSSTNHWAVDAAYKYGKATFAGEYTRSNASEKNYAYAIGVNYAMDKDNTFWAYAHHTEQYGDMGGRIAAVNDNYYTGGMTTWDNSEKGVYYGFDHKLGKDATLSLMIKDNKAIDDSYKYKQYRTTLKFTF